MKEFIIAICIIVLIVLLVPTTDACNDGGTVHYDAIVYDVFDVHRVSLPLNSDGTYETSYNDGLIIKIFGVEIYNNTDPYVTYD